MPATSTTLVDGQAHTVAVSPWFVCMERQPWQPGHYEIVTAPPAAGAPMRMLMAKWTGSSWTDLQDPKAGRVRSNLTKALDAVSTVVCWRGLAAPFTQ